MSENWGIYEVPKFQSTPEMDSWVIEHIEAVLTGDKISPEMQRWLRSQILVVLAGVAFCLVLGWMLGNIYDSLFSDDCPCKRKKA